MKLKALIFSIFLASSISHAGVTDIGNSEVKGSLTLMGVTFNEDTVSIQYNAGGCASKSHININRGKGQPTTLQFYSLAKEMCMAYTPVGEVLTYSYDELGVKPGDSFVIINKVEPQGARWAD